MSKNYAAAVRAKLLTLSKKEGLTFQLLLIRYFQERLLYRLSQSEYRDRFCLKGGALLYAWEGLKSRPTKDVDLLGINVSADAEKLQQIFGKLTTIAYAEDEVLFERQIETEQISKEGGYQGIRIQLEGRLDRIRQRIQVDIGFGDRIVPAPMVIVYPTLLEMAAPKVWAYSVESVIAEKFEAMLDLGAANSRMKDFYDVYQLLERADYQELLLAQAIRETCQSRGTAYQQSHSLFTKEFASNSARHKQWQAFLKRAAISQEISFEEVMERITKELAPIYEALRKQ
jgi:predicted nucleotidyltransferase component of viral defense system